ncbi:hypothetical protein [Nocardioides sp.]|uniref:hypothetical protein n=1 Tax=Nocardioides sp. TaxID=35761 RepID=UPI0027202ED1|nr:hypothetical protein [Nocardioides sp.]MDO9455647.1 hypothetical protein [Nocardioides sp.]
MKRGALVLGAVLLSGTTVVVLSSRSEDSCPTTYEFEGRSYVVHETTQEVTPRNVLGSGTETGCGGQGPYVLEVEMHSVRGVRPYLAVVSAIDARAIYLAPGVGVGDLPPDVAAVVVR